MLQHSSKMPLSGTETFEQAANYHSDEVGIGRRFSGNLLLNVLISSQTQ